jgi:hypothetical protein
MALVTNSNSSLYIKRLGVQVRGHEAHHPSVYHRVHTNIKNNSVYRCVGMKPTTLPCTTEYTQTSQIKVGE